MTSHDFLYSLFSIRSSDALSYALCLVSFVLRRVTEEEESTFQLSQQVDLDS